MKLFGSITELFTAKWRKNGFEITLRPNTGTTYTADRIIDGPPGDTAHVLVSETATQTLTSKSIDGDTNTISDLAVASLKTVIGQANKFLTFDGSGAPTATAKDVPTGVVVGTTDTQTLTNKTIVIADANLSIVDDGDATKILKFQSSGITTGTTRTLIAPDANTTIVGTDATQTLTNKSLTGASITDFLQFVHSASPANPAAGNSRLFFDATGILKSRNSAGTEVTYQTSASGGVDLTTNQSIDGQKTFEKGIFTDDATDASQTIASGKHCQYPGMFIQNTHTITVSGTLVTRNLRIDTGGEIVIPTGGEIILNH